MISRMITGQSPQKVAVVGCGIAGATLASELCVRHPTATCHVFDMGTRGPGERPGLERADDPQHAQQTCRHTDGVTADLLLYDQTGTRAMLIMDHGCRQDLTSTHGYRRPDVNSTD